jgi:thiamine biosynthesis lipoprotein
VLHVFALLVALAGPATAAPVSEIHYVMGTYFSITIDDLAEQEARAAMRRCFSDARRLEGVFSRYDPSSELSQLNASNERGPIEVSADLADLLARSLHLRTATNGTFDVTIGALTPLLRGGVSTRATHASTDPSGQERARFLADGRLVVAPGAQLDFDGIAKGYAVDRCVTLLRAHGVRRALLSLGESSQYAIGHPNGAKGWTVTVRDLSGNHALGTLALRDQALSVSSAFPRERHVAHIIDPRSGEPIRHPSIAVVVTDSATDAEAWSKALLINGAGSSRSPAALRVTRQGVERLGKIAFTAYESPQPIGAEAERFL